MTISYDSVVITLILIVDAIAMVLIWQGLQERRKQRIRRLVNATLRKLGVSV